MIYVCKILHNGEEYFVRSFYLDQFTSGFWINKDFQFTAGGDAHIWIPPHKIEYIYKEEE